MNKDEQKKLKIKEKDVPFQFVERVLLVSLPTALMLIVLVLANEVNVSSAIAGFAMVVFSTIVMALPFLSNLKKLTQYVSHLAQNEEISLPPTFGRQDEETIRIIAAINEMRNIWTTKTEQLQAQTLSDAAILDSLPDPLLMFDKQGLIIGANLAARELFGFHVRGQTIQLFINSQHLPLAVDRILKKKSKKETLEIYLKERIFSAKIERLPALANAGALAVLTLYDMTAQKQFEQMQVDFIANASHELRTPLSVLSGFIETLQSTAKNDEEAKEKFLKIMQAQAQRMSGLIESLLCLSRLEISKDEINFEKVEVCQILESTKTLLESKANKNKMEIVLNPCPVQGEILGEASRLQQVFQNLIDNAIKYGQQGKKINVSCYTLKNEDFSEIKAKELYAICVHNAGATIPQQHLAHLFERFYRVAETKNKAVGTGLGLSIVQQILKSHNGAIKVASSYETGTSFTVFLPISPLEVSEEIACLKTTKEQETANLKTR